MHQVFLFLLPILFLTSSNPGVQQSTISLLVFLLKSHYTYNKMRDSLIARHLGSSPVYNLSLFPSLSLSFSLSTSIINLSRFLSLLSLYFLFILLAWPVGTNLAALEVQRAATDDASILRCALLFFKKKKYEENLVD